MSMKKLALSASVAPNNTRRAGRLTGETGRRAHQAAARPCPSASGSLKCMLNVDTRNTPRSRISDARSVPVQQSGTDETRACSTEPARRLLATGAYPSRAPAELSKRLIVVVLVIPVGDLAGCRDPDLLVAQDVLKRPVEPLGAKRLAGDEGVYGDAEDPAGPRALFVQYVELIAQHLT